MNVLIPMSGVGQRFVDAGYSTLKPLIEVGGRPIIQHVLDMFPGGHDFTLVCSNIHLNNNSTGLRAVLETLDREIKIIGIEPHKKGPGYAVQQVFDHLDLSAPLVINYCDFACYWEFDEFERFLDKSACDGAIPCYTGFHPHTLWSTSYAYVKESQGWAQSVQEKQPFSDNPTSEYASSGTYYFASGALAKTYIQESIERDLNVGGEYYLSLAYQPMIEDGLKVAVYELQHFMQWGTPEDLGEFNKWYSLFEAIPDERNSTTDSLRGQLVMPMAGAGTRFAAEGYAQPKPLISVAGKPMYKQALNLWPNHENTILITRSEIVESSRESFYGRESENIELTIIDGMTEGQASTCSLVQDRTSPDNPMTIAPCDSGAIYDPVALNELLNGDADVVVWGSRGHPRASRFPDQYGWINESEGLIQGISTKVALEDPKNDPIVIGTFTFKRAEDYFAAANHMYDREGKINGEYYVDECINDAIILGLKCILFEVDYYLPWGTPDEVRTYEYWQSCFHKWEGHRYKIDIDPMVPPYSADRLIARFQTFDPRKPLHGD